MHDIPIVLLTKTDRFSRDARLIAESIFGSRVRSFYGQRDDSLPPGLNASKNAILVSFLSPWIIPQSILDAHEFAINFHPGSTDYPGTGCYNFALYDEAQEFGAVCHHMLAQVDTGALIDERRFPLLPHDSVETLKLRTMVTMLAMFQDILHLIAKGKPLPVADRRWSRRPYTRREMNDLKLLDETMSAREIDRRVRATLYPGYPGPQMRCGDRTIKYPVPRRAAIA